MDRIHFLRRGGHSPHAQAQGLHVLKSAVLASVIQVRKQKKKPLPCGVRSLDLHQPDTPWLHPLPPASSGCIVIVLLLHRPASAPSRSFLGGCITILLVVAGVGSTVVKDEVPYGIFFFIFKTFL